MKAAVYFGSHHIYGDMATSAKSLLVNSDVDKIYFLIEDDEFPEELPDCIEVRNITGMINQLFDKYGPNYNSKWTPVGLIRVALTKVFPDLDVILSIDCDTIVDKDVSDLWSLPMDSYYLAAAREPLLSRYKHGIYINAGVTLFNLKKLREDHKDDEMIAALNQRKLTFVAQDAMSELCQNRILEISSDYNSCEFTFHTDNKKIIHFAGRDDWRDREVVRKFREIPWDKIRGGFMRYMIHACPQRMWYVNDYLIPSMKAQGIADNQIIVWNDTEGKGNLFSCLASFKECGTHHGSTWHIQDDVIISRNFAEQTQANTEGIVCGFACKNFGPSMQQKGRVPISFMWYSFQCQLIPNEIAGEFVEWFNTVKREYKYQGRIVDGRHDDWFFREFMAARHPDAWVVNLAPNIVDHIDYLIGGTIINHARNIKVNRAEYFPDTDLVDELAEKMKNR